MSWRSQILYGLALLIAELVIARIIDGFIWVEPILQANQAGDRFENRTRHIFLLCRTIDLRSKFGIEAASSLFRRKALIWIVWIDGRRRGESQNVARMHIHHDQSAARVRAEDLYRLLT